MIKKQKRKKQKTQLQLCTIVVGMNLLAIIFAVAVFAVAERQ
jgi:hypothetical protein